MRGHSSSKAALLVKKGWPYKRGSTVYGKQCYLAHRGSHDGFIAAVAAGDRTLSLKTLVTQFHTHFIRDPDKLEHQTLNGEKSIFSIFT